jgi:hypothetical protein
MTTPSPDQNRLACEKQLGVVGCAVFLDFIRFSGMPTGRLFAWAKLVQQVVHPDRANARHGRMQRTDISKWKRLLHPDGETNRVTKQADLEFVVSSCDIEGREGKLTLILAFERVSESLCVFSNKTRISPEQILFVVTKAEEDAVTKLALGKRDIRRNVLWLPGQPVYRDIQGLLRRPATAKGGDKASATSKQIRTLMKVERGTGAVRLYPDDWEPRYLATEVLRGRYELGPLTRLVSFRKRCLDFASKFNAEVRATEKGGHDLLHRPSIRISIKSRHVSDPSNVGEGVLNVFKV